MNREIEILLQELGNVDLATSNLQRIDFEFHVWFEMVQKWNRNINLVSRSGQGLEYHLYDSLQYLRAIPKNGRFLDIGSGAGFPGIALKIVLPGWKAVFLDSQKKRVNFLKTVIRKLKMDAVQVIWDRAEVAQYNQNFRGTFDLVTLRGVGEPHLCLALGGAFLKKGGRLIIKQRHIEPRKYPGFVLDQEILIRGLSGAESKLMVFSKCST